LITPFKYILFDITEGYCKYHVTDSDTNKLSVSVTSNPL